MNYAICRIARNARLAPLTAYLTEQVPENHVAVIASEEN